MSQPTRRRYDPSHYTQMRTQQRALPGWIVPGGIVVALLAIMAVAVTSCQGCHQAQDETVQSAVEEGVRTSEEAVTAGGVAADGSSNVQTSFAAYSWDELSQIAREIAASGSEEAAMAVAQKYRLVSEDGRLTGDCKPFTWTDGSSGAVQIAGFYHDDKSDGTGKAGITFITRDSLPQKQAMNVSGNNQGGWEFSDLRLALEDGLTTQVPADISDKVLAVNKTTNNVGASDNDDVTSSTSDRFWLFSKVEIAGELTDSELVNSAVLSREGVQYRLFSDCGVVNAQDNPILDKRHNGEYAIWWTRSSVLGLDSGYYVVTQTGRADDFSYYADNEYGVVLGFCF